MVVKVVVMCVCVCARSCVCKCSGLRLMAGIFHLSSSFLFETGSHYVSLTGLELAMLASSPGIHREPSVSASPEWDIRLMLPHSRQDLSLSPECINLPTAAGQ